MAAEKSISVTHIVNGCTRLQPIVLLHGPGGGCLRGHGGAGNGIEPRDVNLRDLQEVLLLRDVVLYPTMTSDARAGVPRSAEARAGAGWCWIRRPSSTARTSPSPGTWSAELLVKAAGGKVLPAGDGEGGLSHAPEQLAQGIDELDFSKGEAFAGCPRVTAGADRLPRAWPGTVSRT